MDLLGLPLLIALGVAAVAVPVAVYLLWGRVPWGPDAGSPVRGVLARLGLVLAAQLAALALVLALMNNYADFFKSWTDAAQGVAQMSGLYSADHAPQPYETLRPSVNPSITQSPPAHAPTTTAASPAPGGGLTARSDATYSTPDQWSTRGRLEKVEITGVMSQLRSPAYVYLPPQYFQPRYAHTWFPAVEVFTGYPGVAWALVGRMKYQDRWRELVEQGKARPTVLVMLRPSVTFPHDTECTDVPAAAQALTFFAADVPDQVGRHYRVLPNAWGTIGDSTGGYCATKITMLNPDPFRAAVSLSGYFFALRDNTTGDLWGGSAAVRDRNDLQWRLQHLSAPDVSVLVATSPSERGPDGYRQALRFVRAVRPPMRVDLLTVPHGGHNITTWNAELPTALSWLSARLPAPGPSPAFAAGPGR